jgi:5-methylcytosine-specific restriction endonuclease McrA
VSRRGIDPVGFAEKVLSLLELGSFSATYKYALFTAIMDICLESASPVEANDVVITTRQLADRVIELYWQHSAPYEGGSILRQGGVRTGNQAEILSAISGFRARYAGEAGVSPFRARLAHPDAFEALIHKVEWKLIEMPIPRLQIIGREEDRFLYEYGWSQTISRREVAAYQRRTTSTFDNRLLLKPGIAEAIKSVVGILRPLVRREWSMMVAAMNGLPETKLEAFMFGASRVQLDAIRLPLRELHDNRCFYCDGRMDAKVDVDHFIPWARYADNGLDNLVPSHAKCNNQKRDFIAAATHLERWGVRIAQRNRELSQIATDYSWVRDPLRTVGVARSIYTRLPAGARLWNSGNELVPADRKRVEVAFRSFSNPSGSSIEPRSA